MKVHCHVHKSLPLGPSSMYKPTPSHPISLKINIHIIPHLHSYLPTDLFISSLQTQILYALFISPTYVTCPNHLILTDLIILITSREEYRL